MKAQMRPKVTLFQHVSLGASRFENLNFTKHPLQMNSEPPTRRQCRLGFWTGNPSGIFWMIFLFVEVGCVGQYLSLMAFANQLFFHLCSLNCEGFVFEKPRLKTLTNQNIRIHPGQFTC